MFKSIALLLITATCQFFVDGTIVLPNCGGCESFEYDPSHVTNFAEHKVETNENECLQTLICNMLPTVETKLKEMSSHGSEYYSSIHIHTSLLSHGSNAVAKMDLRCKNGIWNHNLISSNETVEFKNKQTFYCEVSFTPRSTPPPAMPQAVVATPKTATPHATTILGRASFVLYLPTRPKSTTAVTDAPPVVTTAAIANTAESNQSPECGTCPVLYCGGIFTAGMIVGKSKTNGTTCSQTITCYNSQNAYSYVSLILALTNGGTIVAADGQGVADVKVDLKCSNGQWYNKNYSNISLANIFFCENSFSNATVVPPVLSESPKIEKLEKEVEKYRKLYMESNCSVCNVNGSSPCLNGGICEILDKSSYVCQCPDDYSGNHCEQHVACSPGDCGNNATCTVFNHNKVCSCPMGYTGNECNIKPARACINGDPHYTTFDGSYFTYMGTCPYIITQTFDNSFILTGYNSFRGERKGISYLTSFELFTKRTTFEITSDLKLLVEGTQHFFPYYYPSLSNPVVKITKAFDRVEIHDNSTGALIDFKDYQLCISVPRNQLFSGSSRTRGVLGDIDGICSNDFVFKNETALNITCNQGSSMIAAEFVDSWITNLQHNNCVPGRGIQNRSNCDSADAQLHCSPIRDSISGTGPFGKCQNLTEAVIIRYYEDCIFDVCRGYPWCNVLDAFATTCLGEIPFTKIDAWREQTNCTSSCPEFSHYSLQTPVCQNTCADPNYSNSTTCHDDYQEGCKCWPGYYLDSVGDNGFSFACRRLSDCGCTDTEGNYYPLNTQWLNENCTSKYHCYSNKTILSESAQCSANGQCGTSNDGETTCQCSPGYTGDGYTCVDVDECQNNSTICNEHLGHGSCVNANGSFRCNCNSSWGGDNCEILLPKRHCADWFVYHRARTNGIYNITIGPQEIVTTVYCDMESAGGGWTLVSHGNSSAGKTFEQYVQGFGAPENKDVWLGLENLHLMTNQTRTSLRVVIERCQVNDVPDTTRECFYPTFSVLPSTMGYPVYIPEPCSHGNETIFDGFDGWIRWPQNETGPVFTTFDKDFTSYNCSTEYKNTGWWYFDDESGLCGAANLNGLRQGCAKNYLPQGYLTWHYDPVGDAWMYLRPARYPNYDKLKIMTIYYSNDTSSSSSAKCTDQWHYYEPTDSCYLYTSEKVDWQSGENYCQTLGAHLASIHSLEEMRFIKDSVVASCTASWPWTGLHSINNGTTWQWSDSSPVDNVPWYFGKSVAEDGLCVVRMIGCLNETLNSLYNKNCSDKYATVCRKQA